MAAPPASAEETVTEDPALAAPAAGERSSGSTPVFTQTLALELSEYFSETIELAGWAPIELSPNGDWYREHTALDAWDSVTKTWKRKAEGCTLPGACNVLGPSGVLGADNWAEAEASPSAVWTGSGWHATPDNTASELSMLCPEGSYCLVYALMFGQVLIGPSGGPYISLKIPSCGEHCGQGLLIRNWLERPGVDLNTTVVVRDYGEPGAASFTEYVVPPEAAQYFSEPYSTDQVVNAHKRNNNGSGPGDNTLFIQHVLDLNDMSYTILGHTAEQGWFLVWTNVVAYGDH